MDAAVAGNEVTVIVKGLEGIKQRAQALLRDLQTQREERQAEDRKKTAQERRMTSRGPDADKQKQIETISSELNTSLRLSRVDGAIKELLAFLEDDEFYAANATTARKRRLRSLQN